MIYWGSTVSKKIVKEKIKKIVKEKIKRNAPIKNHAEEAELVKIFWAAPMQALFGENTIAAVTQRSVRTLQQDRYSKIGIPFSKMLGRVIYKKSDIIEWIDLFAIHCFEGNKK